MPSPGKESRSRRAWRVVKLSFRLGFRSGLATVRMLLAVMIPVIAVMIGLEAFGLLPKVARLFAPFMRVLGLPGDAALVFISGAFVNLYTAVAVAANVALTCKQMTVLAILCLVCHNLPVECAVQKRAGTGIRWMLTVRLVTGFAGALAVHWLIPETGKWLRAAAHAKAAQAVSTRQLLYDRLTGNGVFLLKVVVLVMALMILMELLRQTGVLRMLTVLMRPLTWLAGLPRQTGFSVMTSMTLGLAYGAGTVIAESKQGHLSREEQFRTNVFLGTTHSLFEDTMLFVIIHASALWIVVARLVIGCIAVRLFSFARWLIVNKFRREGA